MVIRLPRAVTAWDKYQGEYWTILLRLDYFLVQVANLFPLETFLIPYGGNVLLEKTFTNWLKVDSCGNYFQLAELSVGGFFSWIILLRIAQNHKSTKTKRIVPKNYNQQND